MNNFKNFLFQIKEIFINFIDRIKETDFFKNLEEKYHQLPKKKKNFLQKILILLPVSVVYLPVIIAIVFLLIQGKKYFELKKVSQDFLFQVRDQKNLNPVSFSSLKRKVMSLLHENILPEQISYKPDKKAKNPVPYIDEKELSFVIKDLTPEQTLLTIDDLKNISPLIKIKHISFRQSKVRIGYYNLDISLILTAILKPKITSPKKFKKSLKTNRKKYKKSNLKKLERIRKNKKNFKKLKKKTKTTSKSRFDSTQKKENENNSQEFKNTPLSNPKGRFGNSSSSSEDIKDSNDEQLILKPTIELPQKVKNNSN